MGFFIFAVTLIGLSNISARSLRRSRDDNSKDANDEDGALTEEDRINIALAEALGLKEVEVTYPAGPKCTLRKEAGEVCRNLTVPNCRVERTTRLENVTEDCAKQREYCDYILQDLESEKHNLICSNSYVQDCDGSCEDCAIQCLDNSIVSCTTVPQIVAVTEKKQFCGPNNTLTTTKICLTYPDATWVCRENNQAFDCDRSSVKMIAREVTMPRIDCVKSAAAPLCTNCRITRNETDCVGSQLSDKVEGGDEVCEPCLQGRTKLRSILYQEKVCVENILDRICTKVEDKKQLSWRKYCGTGSNTETEQDQKDKEGVPRFLTRPSPSNFENNSSRDETLSGKVISDIQTPLRDGTLEDIEETSSAEHFNKLKQLDTLQAELLNVAPTVKTTIQSKVPDPSPLEVEDTNYGLPTPSSNVFAPTSHEDSPVNSINIIASAADEEDSGFSLLESLLADAWDDSELPKDRKKLIPHSHDQSLTDEPSVYAKTQDILATNHNKENELKVYHNLNGNISTIDSNNENLETVPLPNKIKNLVIQDKLTEQSQEFTIVNTDNNLNDFTTEIQAKPDDKSLQNDSTNHATELCNVAQDEALPREKPVDKTLFAGKEAGNSISTNNESLQSRNTNEDQKYTLEKIEEKDSSDAKAPISLNFSNNGRFNEEIQTLLSEQIREKNNQKARGDIGLNTNAVNDEIHQLLIDILENEIVDGEQDGSATLGECESISDLKLRIRCRLRNCFKNIVFCF